jgi:nitrous oxidase accessory protein NosD
MSKEINQRHEEDGRHSGPAEVMTNSPDNFDPDRMFADGKISFSKYIIAKKNVVLSGSYKLDAPVIVDNEEIAVSGGNKPLIIEAAFDPAFLVSNGGRLKLNNLELRTPPEMILPKAPVKINILVKEFSIPGFGASKNKHSARVAADNGSVLEIRGVVIEGAAACGVKIEQSEFYADHSEINHCRTMGIVLKNSSAAMKKLTLAENGTRDMTNAQIWAEKSAMTLDRCTVRTSRGGDGISLRNESKAEVRGGSICGNTGNGLSLYESSSVDVTDCKIADNGVFGKMFAQIYLDKSSAKIAKATVTDSRGGSGIALDGSRAEVESCSIRRNANQGFSIKNSSVIEIRDCSIKENAIKSKSDMQIYIENSSAVLEKCLINDAKGHGVMAKKGSKVRISDSTIKGNAGNALSACDLSSAELRDCKISGNGTEKKIYAQIYLDHSTADVANCEITEAVGGPGIALFRQSEISVSSCVISKNGDNGITVFKSPRVEVRDCKMMWNGTVGACYAHIYLEMATALIERCHLYESHYGYAVYIYGKKRILRQDSFCDVTIRDCLFERNRLGLCVENLSKLRMSGSTIENNKEGDTMFAVESDVTIEDDPGAVEK